MTIKEAIDVLERNCDFHYDETDKCYGCLFENSGWCGEDFHENLLTLLKDQEPVEPIRDANNVRIFRCGACGEYVGFDLRPYAPIELDNYCKRCGREVKQNA